MKYIALLSLLLFFASSIQQANAHPENRCRITHCLCKVRGDVGQNNIPSIQTFQNITTSENSKRDLKNTCSDRKLSIYFEYDKYNLNSNDNTDIYNFIRKNNFAGGFYIEGFASSAGNTSYNQKLSQLRNC